MVINSVSIKQNPVILKNLKNNNIAKTEEAIKTRVFFFMRLGTSFFWYILTNKTPKTAAVKVLIISKELIRLSKKLYILSIIPINPIKITHFL